MNNLVKDLDDLCDFGKATQRWKQAPVIQAKQQNISPSTDRDDSSISESSSSIKSKTSQVHNNPWDKENHPPINEDMFKKAPKVRSHIPQVIDEDTEQFKLRLEHLLNVFKTEATSEFMQMKRSMLEDQKDQIKGETERYLQMYEQKGTELGQVKEQLADKMRECVILNERSENMAKKVKMAKTFSSKKQLRTGMNLWKLVHYREFKDSLISKMHVQQQKEQEELVGKFSKEQQLLEQRLNEALFQLDDANKLKQNMQENLKRAFMRGVCALNFEAMNVLNGQAQLDVDTAFQQVMLNNPLEPQSKSMLSMTINNEASESSPPRNVTYFNKMRVETNDHQWRDAPLVGNNVAKQSELPKEISRSEVMEDISLDDSQMMNEGKVIKVNVDAPAIRKNVNVNAKQQEQKQKNSRNQLPQQQGQSTKKGK